MIPVRPVRRPLDGLSPYDTEAVTRWALQQSTDEIVRSGTIRPRLVLVLDDHIAEVDLLDQTKGDPVGTLMALRARGDIEHRLLFGCMQEDGQWIAWVFGAENDDQRSFWLATTPFEVRPGGVGAGTGSWELVQGIEQGSVPFPAVTLTRTEPPMDLLPAQAPQTLQIGCIAHDIPANLEAPRDAVSATNVMSEMGMEDRAWKEGIEGTLVVIFRERTFEKWHVLGEIPFSLDDLIRNMCAYGDEALAAVTLSIDVFPYEGEHYRAVKMVAEAKGVRFERLLAMLWAEGEAPEPSHLRYFASQPRDVGSDGWVGVPPVTEVELFPLGPEA